MIRKLKPLMSPKPFLILKDNRKLVEIEFSLNNKNLLVFDDGNKTDGVCIRCNSKPCMYFPTTEIDADIIDGLPFNNDTRTCPSKAISLNGTGSAYIDSEKCINCGICVTRCPSAAIYYDKKNEAFEINNTADENYFEESFNHRIESEKAFLNTPAVIKIDKITKEFASRYREKFKALSTEINDLELILVRNLLLQVGLKTKSSAIGNNDVRLDFIGKVGSKIMPGESELIGTDILGLTRKVLEGVAWLQVRMNVPKNKQIPVIVVFEFPRKRSDFYEVISDIEKITNIQIRTLSVYFLTVLALFKKKISEADFQDKFLINKDHQNFGPYIQSYVSKIEQIDDNFGSELYTFLK